jgi:hypothetical protein
VYKAQITSDNGKVVKNYIGMTAGPFKLRYSNHLKSLNNERYSTCRDGIIEICLGS